MLQRRNLFTRVSVAASLMMAIFGSTSCGSDDGETIIGGGTIGIYNSHEYVDLGLPSGLKWATCNVGATSPEEYGDYFAWGETEPKTEYSWSNYKWGRGDYKDLTIIKYNTSSRYGAIDNKTVLDPEDDAAHVNWGGKWRMSTEAEQSELRTNCSWTKTKKNGVVGFEVTGPNGNTIFLPAAGGYSDRLHSTGTESRYWSSSLDMYKNAYASILSGNLWDRGVRDGGYSVRPVFL